MARVCAGVYINISPLEVGWAKLVEITRYIRAFQDSGKFCWAYMELGGEKEYYLACACGQIFIPPSSAFSLKGFAVQGEPGMAAAMWLNARPSPARCWQLHHRSYACMTKNSGMQGWSVRLPTVLLPGQPAMASQLRRQLVWTAPLTAQSCLASQGFAKRQHH